MTGSPSSAAAPCRDEAALVASRSPDHQATTRARAVAAVAIAVFVAQGWVITGKLSVFHEELALYAAVPSRYLVIVDGKARVVDPCTAGDRIVFADDRPSTVLCAGGLAWPVLTAPYIGGMHYWVLQLLRPLHRGDPIAVR